MKPFLQVTARLAAVLILTAGVAYLCGVRVHWTTQTMTVVVDGDTADPNGLAARRILTGISGITQVSQCCTDAAGARTFACRAQRIVNAASIQEAFAPTRRAWIRDATIGRIEISWGKQER